MIPVGDSPRTSTTAYVNYALIFINIAVFIRMLTLSSDLPASVREQRATFQEMQTVCYGFPAAPTEIERFVCRWSFQPQEFFDVAKGASKVESPNTLGVILTLITAMFLHAGWLHIVGNMLFLWVFGDNIEDRLGHGAYLLFYLAGGIAATLVQGFMDPVSNIPVVGASGAVAAVLGSYIVFFPRASVRVVLPFFPFFFIPLPIPAIIMIGVWFAQNLFSGIATFNGSAAPTDSVAWFAHIGGFLFGAVLTFFVFRPLLRRPPRWRGS